MIFRFLPETIAATLVALIICALGLLAGCTVSPADVTAALVQLKNDPATVCITVVGPWGTVMAARTNQPSSTIKPGCDVAQGSAASGTTIIAPTGLQLLRP